MVVQNLVGTNAVAYTICKISASMAWICHFGLWGFDL